MQTHLPAPPQQDPLQFAAAVAVDLTSHLMGQSRLVPVRRPRRQEPAPQLMEDAEAGDVEEGELKGHAPPETFAEELVAPLRVWWRDATRILNRWYGY